ncbi:nuclear transport factor 2 family protein [Euzebya tangerina]|uniref:nuclear transport factor 2 family protein n=1 Tax=Euzebya tangerina TaxID=591198 RepID=UPI0013C2F540|nr:nuclear transport factor 2 family protein [Euzebya tangerina]
MSTSAAEDVIVAYFEAINGEDWAALQQVYATDAVVSPPGGEPIRGRPAIVAWYQAVFRRFPDHTDTPVRTIVAADGGAAAVEIEFTGRTTAGRQFAVTAVDIFDIADGRITAMRSWLDTAAFAAATQDVTP